MHKQPELIANPIIAVQCLLVSGYAYVFVIKVLNLTFRLNIQHSF